jgi:ATP-dependent helicase/nuclease subunit B
MLQPPLYLPPSAAFWAAAAQAILDSDLPGTAARAANNFAQLRVVVPTVTHVHLLHAALAQKIGRAFIPPRICTMPAWLALQAPAARIASESERLMALYAELRQHAWLKKLFTARSNTDLLPLAQTLLTLCDELSEALLPSLDGVSDGADARWDAALAQLSPGARDLLSQESQLVWSVWKTQLDSHDAQVARLAAMLLLAERAEGALIWIAPIAPDAFDTAFLQRYALRMPVLPVLPAWDAQCIDGAYAAAWPELFDAPVALAAAASCSAPAGLALSPASSLEDEALSAAQTVIDWLQSGKSSIAIIAQDRVVARRIRALLERADVFVNDETGWKLSTTRAAAALAAWFDVVTGRADTVALLDLLKSPFMLADDGDKALRVMTIEQALRRANVSGGWKAVQSALERVPEAQQQLALLAQQAAEFKGRRTLPEWLATTEHMLDTLQMRAALAADEAGAQLLDMLRMLAQDCIALGQGYSFAEWRAFMNLRMESQPFLGKVSDRRVMMLPLNGARMRSFDAVLLVGADAEHLPSKPQETLFFANAVRRELGLATRESRQRQQLRDFVEMLQANPEVVLSWQAHKHGEPNPLSPWIARLQLHLQRAAAAPLATHRAALPLQRLQQQPVMAPMPSAAPLLPAKLSASGYNTLVACPYQFFATRMLGLSAIDELSDMPEKRDYGDWLHRILNHYHEALRAQTTPVEQRLALLMRVSDEIFSPELAKNAAALGYYVRWKKTAPAYLDWANARQAQGWEFAFGELALEKQLVWGDKVITLHGRIDRVDENAEGERAVLDYKTTEMATLKNRLAQGEDQQLAFYGLLSDQPVSQAHYVALEATRDKTGDVAAARYAEWQAALRAQITANLDAIGQGAPLTASGIAGSCAYCDMRGLCRKGAW